jgi:hypothetical protein
MTIEKPPLGSLVLPRMAEAGGYLFTCCDCGLTHRLDFTITPTFGLAMRVFAAPDETAKARRERDDFLDETPETPAVT